MKVASIAFLFTIVAFFLFVASPCAMAINAGGLSENEIIATRSIQQIVNSVKQDFFSKNPQATILHAVSYKSQLVAGTNYFVKVATGIPCQTAVLRIYKDLNQNTLLHSFKLYSEEAENVQIEYF